MRLCVGGYELWVLALFTFSVLGCGGGESSSSAEKPEPPPVTTPSPEPEPAPLPEPSPEPDCTSVDCVDEPAVGQSALFGVNWVPGDAITNPHDASKTSALQDYSYAGFAYGESSLPEAIAEYVISVINDGSADVSGDIQKVLDQAVSLGGGVLYLPEGLYRLDKPLAITGSDIVLRGAGPGKTRLWFKDGGGTSNAHRENFTMTGGQPLQYQRQTDWRMTTAAAINDTSVTLSSAQGLSVGDDIVIAWKITADFKAEHNSAAYWSHVANGELKPFFRRTITSISGNRITFKTPVRYPVKLRDNPEVQKALHYGERNGLEALSITNAVGVENAWRGFDKSTLIALRFCKNCWVKQVTSYDQTGSGYELRSHGIAVDQSVNVTISDTRMANAEHLGGNGNGYLYQVSASNEVLIKNSEAINGRHNFSFSWDFGASGNVFLRVKSEGGRVCSSYAKQLSNDCTEGGADFHHALSMANLYDSAVINDSLRVGNRLTASSGAGQTGTMNVFWNIRGRGNLYAYNYGAGYVIGTSASISVSTDLALNDYPERLLAIGTEEEDYTELLGQAEILSPQSLYEAQLARRR